MLSIGPLEASDHSHESYPEPEGASRIPATARLRSFGGRDLAWIDALLTFAAMAAILAAGFAAGAINTIVGSGSLITFPTLLALGYPPVVANVSNTVGLVFGSMGGVFGYRRELAGQSRRLLWLAVPTATGAIVGAYLLLVLPQRVFKNVVPVLIAIAIILVLVQPWLSRRVNHPGGGGPARKVLLAAGTFGTAVYGGYFGAAQGVILMSILMILVDDSLQRLNALKNVFAAVVNGIAAVYFVLVASVAWEPAILIAVSSVVGSQVGALAGRRFSPLVLRGVIVAAGAVGLVKLLT